MVAVETLTKEGYVQNYIDGEWETPSGDNGQDTVNPATGETLAYVHFSSDNDVERAIGCGQEAFETWSSRPVEERIQPMFQFKSLLEDHHDELAELLVEDHGKTFAEAKGELRRGIENVEVACGIPSMMQSGSLLNAAPGIDEQEVRHPLGVFAAITPFNFPGMIPLWFLPYAVATGNCFLLKPSEQDPLVPQRLMELLDQTDLPNGVVQMLNGGPDTVNALLEADGIEGVSFVGSTPVAQHIYETSAVNGKRVQAQGGAKNYVIVTETADLEYAATKSVSSSYACTGQRCLANDIAVVEESVYDDFADHVVEVVRSQTTGYGLDESVDLGPLISPEHEQRVRDYVETGIDEGATLLHDGRDVEVPGYEEGNFMGPVVFGDVTPDMTIAQEELFGPVLGLMSATDVEEAIEFANGTDYGNAASLFTGSGADARKARHDLDVGNLGVNAGTAAPMAFFHFGGTKQSFFGDLHAQGEDMIHFYTDKKVYIERWPDA